MNGSTPVRPAIAVLGDITVSDAAGTDISLSAQRREILAAIAAGAGSIVPQSALLHAIWGEDSDSARGSLKSQLTNIRRHLDRGLSIEWVNRAGYRLKGPLDLLDTTRFEQLVTSARDLPPELAAPQFARALALWRAPLPFLNVNGSALVDSAVWRLVALRDEVIRALADCEIVARSGACSLPYLEQLFADDPQRSDITVRLAKLYALNGRHSHGLATINAHRDALANIGAVISPEAADVDTQILRYELGPQARPILPREGEPSTFANVRLQRTAWVDEVVETLTVQSVLVTGEAGVGKTTLTRLVAERLEALEVPVLRAAVLEAPFRSIQVIASILEQLQTVLAPSTTRALRSKRLADARARVLQSPAEADVPATTRDELLANLTDLIATAMAGTGAVLVVEDTQWLDATSAEIITALIDRGDVRLLVTSRPQSQELIADAHRLVTMELPTFDRAEVEELLRLALPLRATSDLAASLHHQTGGNPLFLGLLLEVISRGELGGELPLTLQAAVHERTAALSRNSRELLQLASLLGQTFPLTPLRHLRRRTGEHLAAAEEEELVALDLSALNGHFVHGLVSDALAAAIPAGPRVSWHDELCRALRTCGFPAVAIAPHALAAAELDPIRAAGACADAADEHAAVFEWAVATDWATRGLEIVQRYRMDGQLIEAQLRAVLGSGLRRTNRPGSDHELVRAADIAGEYEYEAEALLVRCVVELCLHGFTTTAGDVDARARRHLDYALTLDLADHHRAELLAAAATLFASSPEVAVARRLYHEARDIALRSENEHVLRTVLMNSHLGLAHPDDLALRWDSADRLARLDDAEAQWEAEFVRFSLGIVTADRDLVDTAAERLRDLAPAVRRRERARGMLQIETVAAFIRGDLAEAERLADESFAACISGYSESWAISIYSALLFPVRSAQGRLGEFWDILVELMRAHPEYTSWFAMGAVVADVRGDTDAAAALLDTVREHGLTLVEDTTWTAVATDLCIPIWRRPDPSLARMLYEQLAPYSGQMTWNGLSTHGPVDGGLALLAATLGRIEQAKEHLSTARDLVDRFRAPHLWWPVLDELAELADDLADDLAAADADADADADAAADDADADADADGDRTLVIDRASERVPDPA